MNEKVAIGEASRLSGLSVKTIRFYEDEGVLPRPRRSESGRRVYGQRELRQLRLAANARNLGLPPASIQELVRDALSAGCGEHAARAGAALTTQVAAIDARIAELTAARAELLRLSAEAGAVAARVAPEQRVEDCPCCLMIEGGESSVCKPRAPAPLDDIPLEVLDALACDLSVRPADAPSPMDLAESVQSIVRDNQQLTIRFDPAVADAVARFARAEQQCCSTIQWKIDREDPATLRISAKPEQLAIIEGYFVPDGAE
jgi:DNA-binding transcriptional MerR regulator